MSTWLQALWTVCDGFPLQRTVASDASNASAHAGHFARPGFTPTLPAVEPRRVRPGRARAGGAAGPGAVGVAVGGVTGGVEPHARAANPAAASHQSLTRDSRRRR